MSAGGSGEEQEHRREDHDRQRQGRLPGTSLSRFSMTSSTSAPSRAAPLAARRDFLPCSSIRASEPSATVRTILTLSNPTLMVAHSSRVATDATAARCSLQAGVSAARQMGRQTASCCRSTSIKSAAVRNSLLIKRTPTRAARRSRRRTRERSMPHVMSPPRRTPRNPKIASPTQRVCALEADGSSYGRSAFARRS